MTPKSFQYAEPRFGSKEAAACPHCKQPIRPADSVHWYNGALWHTKPCPTR